jgi:RNA polymerase sigma-70 factor (ECF subfamily)
MAEIPQEFEDLYAKSYPRLVAQLTVITGNLHEAQDCVQEAMCRTWDRWEKVRSYSDPEGWTRRVALNLSVSRWRKLRRLLPLSDAPESEVSAQDDTLMQAVALSNTLADVPQRQREALVLHYVVDLSIEQVANEMGVRPGTVKSMLSRGRTHMKSLLEDKDPASGEKDACHSPAGESI